MPYLIIKVDEISNDLLNKISVAIDSDWMGSNRIIEIKTLNLELKLEEFIEANNLADEYF